MQRSWREDADKCTFIVLDRNKFEDWKPSSTPDDVSNKNSKPSSTEESRSAAMEFNSSAASTEVTAKGSNMLSEATRDDVFTGDSSVSSRRQREIDAMIGDVNLFFIEDNEDDDGVCEGNAYNSKPDGLDSKAKDCENSQERCFENNLSIDGASSTVDNSSRTKPLKLTAEVELMIAEPSSRGRGRGKESLLLLLLYGAKKLGVEEFIAKIGAENGVSQNLFERIGFRKTKFNDVFQEVTMKAGSEEVGGVVGSVSKDAVFVTRTLLHSR